MWVLTSIRWLETSKKQYSEPSRNIQKYPKHDLGLRALPFVYTLQWRKKKVRFSWDLALNHPQVRPAAPAPTPGPRDPTASAWPRVRAPRWLVLYPQRGASELEGSSGSFFLLFFFSRFFFSICLGEKMAWSQNRMGTSSKSNGFETHILSHRVALRVWLEGFAELMIFCHFTQENPPFGKNKRLINLLVVVQQIHVSDLHLNLSQNVMFHGFSYIFKIIVQLFLLGIPGLQFETSLLYKRYFS